MLKATSLDKRGCESFPVSVEVNDAGYVELPEDPDAVAYHLYAPMPGFEIGGPWYLWKIIRRRIAKQARFTIAAVDYQTSDLIAALCPDPLNEPYVFTLPQPEPGQEFWMIGGTDFAGTRYTPYAIVECPK